MYLLRDKDGTVFINNGTIKKINDDKTRLEPPNIFYNDVKELNGYNDAPQRTKDGKYHQPSHYPTE